MSVEGSSTLASVEGNSTPMSVEGNSTLEQCTQRQMPLVAVSANRQVSDRRVGAAGQCYAPGPLPPPPGRCGGGRSSMAVTDSGSGPAGAPFFGIPSTKGSNCNFAIS